MNNYSYEYIQFLREKILQYLPFGFSLNGSGQYNGRCPFCGDSHKNSQKKRGYIYFNRDCSYYCFNCGISMSGIGLLQALSGENYDEIKKEYLRLFVKSGRSLSLSSYVEPQPEEPGIFQLKRLLDPALKKPLTDDARKYLESRKIFDAPFLKEDLFSCIGKDREYIIIPWMINGIDAYYQLNDFKKYGQIKYIFPKNKRKLIYGLDNVDASWPYIIVFEGVYDSVFVKNGIAVGTKSINDYQLKLIRERYPDHQICLAFDNDKPGLDSTVKFIQKTSSFKFFRWFDRSTREKDINEYVLAKNDVNAFSDPEKLKSMIFSALQTKLWMVQNGLWKDGRRESKHSVNRINDQRRFQRPPWKI